jgi:hypothetical protein
MSVPEAAKRIYTDLGGETKLIFIVRNPAKRAYSAYMMDVLGGKMSLSFEEALRREISGTYERAYLDKGFYARHVKRFKTYFSMDKIAVFKFEEVISNQDVWIRDVSAFLGVVPPEKVETVKANTGGTLRFPGTRFLVSSNPVVKKVGEIVAKSSTI